MGLGLEWGSGGWEALTWADISVAVAALVLLEFGHPTGQLT